MDETQVSAAITYWADEEVMRHYYDAICEVRRVFERVHNGDRIGNEESCPNGFVSHPRGDPTDNRAEKGIFLKATFYYGRIRTIDALYTPLGKFTFLPGGCMDAVVRISKGAFEALKEDFEMIDVCSDVRYYLLALYENGQKVVRKRGGYDKEGHVKGTFTTLFQLKYKKESSFTETVNIPKGTVNIFNQIIGETGTGIRFHPWELIKKFSDGKGCIAI